MKNIISIIAAIVLLCAVYLWSADGVLQNVGGNTQLGGSIVTGTGMTNGNVNSFTVFTNNQVSIGFNTSGVITGTNYAAASLGFVFNTNGNFTNAGIIHGGTITSGGSLNASGQANIGSVKPTGFFSTTGANSGGMQLSSGILDIKSFGPGAATYNPITMSVAGSSGGSSITAMSINDTGATFAGFVKSSNSFMLPTNYVAANFTPVAGMVKIVSSNGVLWKVTELTTNLLSQNIP